MNLKESIVGLNKVLNGIYRPQVFSSKGRSYVIIVMVSDTLPFHSFFFFFVLFCFVFFLERILISDKRPFVIQGKINLIVPYIYTVL